MRCLPGKAIQTDDNSNSRAATVLYHLQHALRAPLRGEWGSYTYPNKEKSKAQRSEVTHSRSPSEKVASGEPLFSVGRLPARSSRGGCCGQDPHTQCPGLSEVEAGSRQVFWLQELGRAACREQFLCSDALCVLQAGPLPRHAR